MRQKVPYLTNLTPLRGIAALLVVFGHSNLFLLPFISNKTTHLFENSWLSVDFFFILSGFIMMYVYGKYFKERTSKKDFFHYMGARFARIYPLYFVTLVLATINVYFILKEAKGIDPLIADLFNINAFPACVFLIQSFHFYQMSPLNFPSWSLSTEWWVYMIFPFLVPFFSRLKLSGKLIVTVLLIGLYFFIRNVLGPISAPFHNGVATIQVITDFGLVRCFAGFCTGMLVYELYKIDVGYRLFKTDWFFAVVFIGLFLCLHYNAMDVVCVFFCPFLILAAAYNETVVKRILNMRAFQRLGDWSFSIYMIHAIVIQLYQLYILHQYPAAFANVSAYVNAKPNYTAGMIVCLIVVTLTLILSAFTYRFLEIPARNYFNRLFNKQPKSISADSVMV